MLWRNPKSHIFAKHKARLRVKSRDRTEKYHRDWHKYPLKHHKRLAIPFLLLFGGSGRNESDIIAERTSPLIARSIRSRVIMGRL